jgi:CelD/BcsL family acetyltransferase involved in cellulose biosynthesis
VNYECLRLADVDQDVRMEWRDLSRRLSLNPSLAPDWVDAIASTLAPDARDVRVLIQRHDFALSGVVPFFITEETFARVVPLKVLQLASNLTSYHAELIAGEDAKQLLMHLLSTVDEWDVLRVENVDVESRTSDVIRQIAVEMGTPLQVIPGDTSPYLPIAESWEQFVARQKKRFRYNVRHRRELVDQAEGARLVWYGESGGVDALLDAMLIIEAQSWKAKAGLDIPSKPKERTYYSRLLPMLADGGNLVANVLYLNELPIAYCLNCCIDGWTGHLKTSFVENLSALSPGAFVIDAAVQRAFEMNAREFDFLGAADVHKLAWTDRVRTHANYFLFAPNLKSASVGHIKKVKELALSKWPTTVRKSTGAP